jgi:hypothetical protein
MSLILYLEAIVIFAFRPMNDGKPRMKNEIHKSHHHHSLRLKGYDYSSAGFYFIIICTKDRQNYFGKIYNGEMIPNETGRITELFLEKISTHFSHAKVAEYVVMPNHVHLILALNEERDLAGIDESMSYGIWPEVGTCHGMSLQPPDDGNVGPRHGVAPHPGVSQAPCPSQAPSVSPPVNLFGHVKAGSVSVIINQYKASVKRWCNKNGYNYFRWQSRFYDHIIRNEESYQRISDYICNNPKLWEDDKFYLK